MSKGEDLFLLSGIVPHPLTDIQKNIKAARTLYDSLPSSCLLGRERDKELKKEKEKKERERKWACVWDRGRKKERERERERESGRAREQVDLASLYEGYIPTNKFYARLSYIASLLCPTSKRQLWYLVLLCFRQLRLWFLMLKRVRVGTVKVGEAGDGLKEPLGSQDKNKEDQKKKKKKKRK